MPYTTLVAGTVITASWANANVRDQVLTPFASAGARTTAVTSPVEGQATWLSDQDRLDIYDGSDWQLVAHPRLYADKAGDETVGATGLQDDNDLALDVLDNATYILSGMLFVSGNQSYDIVVGFTLPAAAEIDVGILGPAYGDYFAGTTGSLEAAARLAQTSPSTGVTYATYGSTLCIPLSGRLVTGANAGTLQLRWAPNVAGNVTVHAGSWMRLERML